ncbi:MAG TPA: APC family permease [Vicinamibacterales bacterium]|nr:APC family permease [Vicinamibacterales bacterium]
MPINTKPELIAPPSPSLRRELGRWDLTAIGVNQVIGSGIFALPAALAASAGGWSPFLVAAIGLASLLIALCFAEVGSRFEATGGSYIYTRAAFGRFLAFEVGWMLWFTRAASWASVLNVLADSLAFYWPAFAAGVGRALAITLVVAIFSAINIRGIRLSALVVNGFTIGKLLPLAAFIVVGLFFLDPVRLRPEGAVPMRDLMAGSLLLIFAFGGYETVPVPAGEARDPRRAVPFALIMTLVIVTIVMVLVQVVALGTLAELTETRTPLADAAGGFMGPAGAFLLTLGAVISTSGNSMGQALSGPRSLFALAEQHDIPRFFGYIHPRYRTPSTAVLVTSGVSLVLALSGTFVALAAASAVSRLLVYVATAASVLRLRQPRFETLVKPATFVVPFGPVIPVAAILVSLTIIGGATRLQLLSGVGALLAGALLYAIAVGGAARGSRQA